MTPRERKFLALHDKFDNLFIHPVGTALLAGVSVLSVLGTGGMPLLVFGAGAIGFDYHVKKNLNIPNILARQHEHNILADHHPIAKIVHRLAKDAGLETMPRVIMDRTQNFYKGSAPFLGTVGSPDSSVIIVSPQIEKKLSPSELEAALAHEISHIKANDTGRDISHRSLLNIALMAPAYGMLSLLMAPFGLAVTASLGTTLAIGFGGIAAAVAVKSAISRAAERRADRGAAALTKNPWALASSLGRIVELEIDRLKSMNKPEPGPVAKFLIRLYRTHPKTKLRREYMAELGRKMIEKDPSIADIKKRTITELRAFDLLSKMDNNLQPKDGRTPYYDPNRHMRKLHDPVCGPAISFGRKLPFNDAAKEQDNSHEQERQHRGNQPAPPRRDFS
ncbi:MAG: M48 family metalloprotease [Rhodospirillales bacterium]|nr:M48 family metalloprotease [Rhodospirillales bacterium]MCB9996114.1 M48 family metalloprotease [Rhodospirillales bacterium]